MSIRRTFGIANGMNLDIGADAMNVLNHTQFSGAYVGGLGGTVTTPNTAQAALGLRPGMGNANNFGTRGMATFNPRQIMLRPRCGSDDTVLGSSDLLAKAVATIQRHRATTPRATRTIESTDEKKATLETPSIQSLGRGLTILEAVAEPTEPVALRELTACSASTAAASFGSRTH